MTARATTGASTTAASDDGRLDGGARDGGRLDDGATAGASMAELPRGIRFTAETEACPLSLAGHPLRA